MQRLLHATVHAFALAAAWLVCAPPTAAAQLPSCQFRGAPDALHERPAPLDSIAIRIGDGEAKLCYSRPTAGGVQRVGEEFPYGAPWQLGANEPTTLHLGFPARLGTVSLEPGSYSLYAIPERGDWTVVVNANPNRWGLPIDADVRAADIGSFPLPATSLPEYEDRLTFRFEPAGEREGVLVYSWERTTLAIPLAHR